MNRGPRKLDLAKPASLDIVSLNNKVIVMKSAVRKAKGQKIQKLIRKMQMYRKKSGTEEQLAENQRKVDRLVEDMQAMKKLNLVKVAKYALANTTSFSEICKKEGVPPETRALARLVDHKLIVKEVQDFRDKHEDWQSLANFFLTHISRRYKKNKHLLSKTKMSVNVKAGNEMMKTYLNNKLGQDSDEGHEDEADSSMKKATQHSRKKAKINLDDKNVKSESDGELDSKHTSDSEGSVQSKGLSDDDDDEVDDEKQSLHEEENSSNEISDEDDLTVRGETVVKKLDINDLITSNEDDIPSFLVSPPEEENVARTMKLRDSFFMGSDGESYNDEIEHDDSESDESDIDMDENRTSGKNAIRTTFLGALNSEKNRNRQFDSSRGRGGRGRGDRFNRNSNNYDNVRGRGRGDRFNRESNNYDSARGRGRGGYHSFGSRGRGRGDRFNRESNSYDSVRGRGRGGNHSFGSRGRGQGSYGSSENRSRGRGNFRMGNDKQQGFERRGRGGYSNDNFKRNPRGFNRSESRGRGNQFQSKHSDNVQKNRAADFKGDKSGEKIHPSWEASKKRKEHSNIQAFKGKKIKFDDE